MTLGVPRVPLSIYLANPSLWQFRLILDFCYRRWFNVHFSIYNCFKSFRLLGIALESVEGRPGVWRAFDYESLWLTPLSSDAKSLGGRAPPDSPSHVLSTGRILYTQTHTQRRLPGEMGFSAERNYVWSSGGLRSCLASPLMSYGCDSGDTGCGGAASPPHPLGFLMMENS